ncbi:Fimbrial assembly protein (PilN) [compost metagenome]
MVEQIENQQIGKFSTYNIAAFMQKIIKVIPKTVQLKTITTDDSRNVKITAQSNSYADLGYLVAQMKLENVLKNVKINSITNGTTIAVEIGGELP